MALTKEAQDKLANLIDQGFIQKCAEYGLNYSDSNDKKVVDELMGYSYDKLQRGEIKLDE